MTLLLIGLGSTLSIADVEILLGAVFVRVGLVLLPTKFLNLLVGLRK